MGRWLVCAALLLALPAHAGEEPELRGRIDTSIRRAVEFLRQARDALR